MAHTVIMGMSESGKSTLAKRIANSFQAQGIKVIVFNPLRDWWSDPVPDLQTDNISEVTRVAKLSWSCAIFIEECSDVSTKQIKWFATQARHRGHASHFIAQRGKGMVAPTIRDQCRYLACFRVSLDDAKTLAAEYTKPELSGNDGCHTLDQYEYWFCGRYIPAQKLKLDDR